MKKIFISVMMSAALILGLSSCSCNKDNSKKIVEALVEWSGKVSAEGDGVVKVSFPSGALNVNGDAAVNIYSSSDTLFQAPANLQAVTAETVLAAPANYTQEDLTFASTAQAQFDNAFNVDVLEGSWAVDIELYARQPQSGLVFVFTRHWPEDPENTAESAQ